jgi:ribonucleoside-triphosphate reductase (thioredoxin)
MMGVGVGFDTKGSKLGLKVYRPDEARTKTIVVSDTREGWVDSLRVLLESYMKPDHSKIHFDYS